jgi:hypothetical protein
LNVESGICHCGSAALRYPMRQPHPAGAFRTGGMRKAEEHFKWQMGGRFLERRALQISESSWLNTAFYQEEFPPI